MHRVKITPDWDGVPDEIRLFCGNANIYDSSCSVAARVWYIDRDGGCFLKIAPRGDLAAEAALSRYFHKKGLTAPLLSYTSAERDFLLTERVRGEDATNPMYLSDPARLAVLSGEILRRLHETDFSDCPVPDRMRGYFETVEKNYKNRLFDLSYGPFSSAEEAYRIAKEGQPFLTNDTLIHGDYCLPNFLLDNWQLSGFVDLGNGGVGDRHVDLFWGAWTLMYNLKTDRYRDRFFDAYGRDRIDHEKLAVVAAAEVFG